jgi:hypothetical protein
VRGRRGRRGPEEDVDPFLLLILTKQLIFLSNELSHGLEVPWTTIPVGDDSVIEGEALATEGGVRERDEDEG